MLLFDGQIHYDTQVIPMGNYVIAFGTSCEFKHRRRSAPPPGRRADPYETGLDLAWEDKATDRTSWTVSRTKR